MYYIPYSLHWVFRTVLYYLKCCIFMRLSVCMWWLCGVLPVPFPNYGLQMTLKYKSYCGKIAVCRRRNYYCVLRNCQWQRLLHPLPSYPPPKCKPHGSSYS